MDSHANKIRAIPHLHLGHQHPQNAALDLPASISPALNPKHAAKEGFRTPHLLCRPPSALGRRCETFTCSFPSPCMWSRTRRPFSSSLMPHPPEYPLIMILKGGSCGAGRRRGKRDLRMSAIAAIGRSQALGGNSEVERLSASRRYI